MIHWSEDAQAELMALRQDYAKTLPEKIACLSELWLAFLNLGDAKTHLELIRHLHTLAGSAPSFGLSRVGEVARHLEYLVKNFDPNVNLITDEVRTEIENQIEALRQSVSLGTLPLAWTPSFDLRKEFGKRVFFVGGDVSFLGDLASQMKFLGSTVEIVSDAEVVRAVREIPCAALVLDMDSLPADKLFSLGQEIQQAGSVVPPLIFLSSQGDLANRLSAVRAGGDLYFTKPIETETLNEALENLLAPPFSNSYRILIVEDDPILAASYGLTLKQAGMVTATVTDPLRAMEVLAEFKPELILMDLYMDGCSGMELAKVIRQQVAFVGVPIVFLSSEADPIKQLLALGLGGDDFLTKPVAPERLIASVSIRAERLRTLRALMTRDSLTGLANHTEILAHLERELARTRRNRSSLTFAMIDIDHFKRVNDTYGHPVGDKVIQSLARLFKLRLRHSDFAGRYGGEEFAVVLPDTDRHGAFKILDELRACFSQMTQSCDQGNFLVSFSCGFATFPAHQSVTELIEAADEVLYRAKNAGRDRTEF